MSVKLAVIDSCPGPQSAAGLLIEAKRRSGQTLQSWFRGIEARALLAKYGKHDQTYLYQGWLRRLPGFRPANPPGFSPHECRSDGVSPPGYARGARVPESLCGQDWGPDAYKVIAAYRSMGVAAYHPYNSPLEVQHVGIAKIPKNVPPPLKRGMTDRKRVPHLKAELALCRRPHAGDARYFQSTNRLPGFGKHLDAALRAFQHDHGLAADGVLGPMTQAQLDASVRYWKSHAKVTAPKKPKLPVPRPKPKPAVHPGPLYGVDLSSNNPSPIDAHQVKHAGIDFAHLKMSESNDYPSSTSPYVAEVKKRVHDFRVEGVIIGGYHFARPEPGHSAESEALHFVRMLRTVDLLRKGDLPPVLDIEAVVGLGTADLRKWVKDFCRAVKKQTGVTPWIYTGQWFWGPRLGDPLRFTGFTRYRLWLAAYVTNPAPFVPKAWKGYTLWQFTDKASVPGIPGHCDKSRFNGSLADLKALTIK